jgi:serine/tyrosine/threonine adenylyltransferase
MNPPASSGAALEDLRLDDVFTRELPGDPVAENFRRQVHCACWSGARPTKVAAPALVAHAREVAELLGISEAAVASEAFLEVFSGNRVLPGTTPYAACYGGHQFGRWAGQLGDGRAIGLFEVSGPGGGRFELQLKGAGPTPYSRTADGRAVLRSSVREFLCSEAMHHLGVPTTRALSLVTTGEAVVRDMFYDGRPRPEPGAIVCRVAPSFLRFGSYELFAVRDEIDLLRRLADHTLRHHFPEMGEPGPEAYVRWFAEVCRRTAEMIVHWQRVGFVHGVMNTDNMSILGLTIDYGPYGWLDDYDPDWTPNTTDAVGRRYRYGHQPKIAHWNLAQLGNALYPLVEDIDALQEALNVYPKVFETRWQQTLAEKLGLSRFEAESDPGLVEELFEVLGLIETDMTIFFRRLADVPAAVPGAETASDADLLTPLVDAYYAPDDLEGHRPRIAAWVRQWLRRLAADPMPPPERRARMNAVNPKYVLRNYLAQLAIDAAEQGDAAVVRELLEVMRRPYDEQPAFETWADKRPDWARSRPGCSMLSCSS